MANKRNQQRPVNARVLIILASIFAVAFVVWVLRERLGLLNVTKEGVTLKAEEKTPGIKMKDVEARRDVKASTSDGIDAEKIKAGNDVDLKNQPSSK